MKRGLSHLLVDQPKGRAGATGVVALHVPKAGRITASVPFTFLSVTMLAGP